MITKLLKDIRERADKATSGPWHLQYSISCTHIHGKGDYEYVGLAEGMLIGETNANFIAHARTDVPRLLDALEVITTKLGEQPCYCIDRGTTINPNIVCQWHVLLREIEKILKGDDEKI
jgi:hypothetical protein